jgi:uncharacterized protein
VLQRFETFDLDTLQLRPGDGRRVDARVPVAPFQLAGQGYAVSSGHVDASLDVSRTVAGYALRLRFAAPVEGVCMRCMDEAHPTIDVDAREVDQPGEAEELHSPYVDEGTVELADWARDALALALPAKVLCRDDCRGLCGVCGANINDADESAHRHEEARDPRWAALDQLKATGG